MKNLCYINIFVCILSLCSSCHRNVLDESQDAAMALYCKYAGDERLMVAYVGDLKVEDHAINAVMIQANDDEDWAWLREEFEVPMNRLVELGDTITGQNYTVDMGVQWNTSVDLDEKVLQKEHVDDEEIEFFAQAIVDQLNVTMNALLASENEIQKAVIVIDDRMNLLNDLDLGLEFRDTTAVGRIMAAVAEKLNNDGLAFKDSTVHTETMVRNPEDELMRDAREHGQCGYVTAVDDRSQTLWVFFYSDAEECSCIMAHIKKDVFAKNHQE